MSNLILREWDGKRIRIRADRYVSLTDIAKASKKGKTVADWLRLESTRSYLETLSSKVEIPVSELVQVKKGGADSGTWGHFKVSLRFAQWCSDDLAVQVDFWVDELLTTGTVSLVPAEKMYTIDMVIRRDPATWERMFSDSWIEQAEKLTQWQWNWSCMGQFINDTVYAYLPSDVVETLRSLNPKNDEGRGRIHKHHQFLQPEIRDIVAAHLLEVESLMKAAKGNMDLFKLLMVNHYGRFKLSGEDELPLFKTQTVFMINVA